MRIAPPPSEPLTKLSHKHRIAVALTIACLVIGSAIITIWIGLRFLLGSYEQQANHGKYPQEITIKTPVGPLTVREEASLSSLGLPLYPGAVGVKASDSAAINLTLPNNQTLRVWAAKYETSDALELVSTFYSERLHTQPRMPSDGKTAFEIEQQGEERLVVLVRHDGKTWIQLARIVKGASEPN